MYFLAMALTAEVFILERKDGLIDRHVLITDGIGFKDLRTS